MALNTIRGGGMGLSPAPLYTIPTGILTAQQVGVWNELSMPAGGLFFPPAGTWDMMAGLYTWLQFKDPVTGLWKSVYQSPNSIRQFTTDGYNYRIVNLTGCPVGAFVTTTGSAYTSAPTVTSSAGGSLWTALISSAISQTVTVTTAGVGYNYAPILTIGAPPAGGVQATAIAVVSAGAISSVTMINQGAGYTTVPPIIITPDPRDTPTTNAVLTMTLTTAGSVAAVIPTNHGLPVTAVPTLTFSSGSAAATVVMCFAVTGFTVGTAGVAYGTSQPFLVTTTGGIVAGAVGGIINPQLDKRLFAPRPAVISGTSTSGGAVTATGAVIDDGGLFQAVPNGIIVAGGGALPTTAGAVTLTVGGVTDTVFLQPAV